MSLPCHTGSSVKEEFLKYLIVIWLSPDGNMIMRKPIRKALSAFFRKLPHASFERQPCRSRNYIFNLSSLTLLMQWQPEPEIQKAFQMEAWDRAAKDFVARILGGQRVFESYSLVANLEPYISELNRYLVTAELAKQPLVFEASVLSINAPGIRIPYTKTQGTSFECSNLSGAVLSYGESAETSFSRCLLQGTEFKDRKFVSQVFFYGCQGEPASFPGITEGVKGASLEGAKICFEPPHYDGLDKMVRPCAQKHKWYWTLPHAWWQGCPEWQL